MRIEGRSPSARVVGVIAVAFEISRIIASTFLTISPCSDSSGRRIVGICPSLLATGAKSTGPPRTPSAWPAYYPPYAYGGQYDASTGARDRQGRTGPARARHGWTAAGHQRARAGARRIEGHASGRAPRAR